MLTSMLFSIFVLINIISTLAFFYTIYQAAVLLKKEIGVWALIIFVLGILSISSNSAESSNKKWTYNSEKVFVNNTNATKLLTLEDNFSSKVELLVSYGLDSASKKHLPIEANIMNNGLIVKGSKFIPQYVKISPTENPKLLEYNIHGMRKWQFFFLINHNEDKAFTGFIKIE